MSAVRSASGGKSENICSFGAFPLLTDGVDKVADERVEALYWSAWHATSISFFSTLRLERDYIDAADRRLTQMTFTRRRQPACPVVVARCGLQAF